MKQRLTFALLGAFSFLLTACPPYDRPIIPSPNPPPPQMQLPGGITLDQHLQRVRESHRNLIRMAGEIRAGGQPPYEMIEVQQAAALYRTARQNWAFAGQYMARDIATGQPVFTNYTNQALASAQQSQTQFGEQYARMKRERSMVAGLLLTIQLADHLLGQARNIMDTVERQRVAMAVQQEFVLPDWDQVQPIYPQRSGWGQPQPTYPPQPSYPQPQPGYPIQQPIYPQQQQPIYR